MASPTAEVPQAEESDDVAVGCCRHCSSLPLSCSCARSPHAGRDTLEPISKLARKCVGESAGGLALTGTLPPDCNAAMVMSTSCCKLPLVSSYLNPTTCPVMAGSAGKGTSCRLDESEADCPDRPQSQVDLTYDTNLSRSPSCDCAAGDGSSCTAYVMCTSGTTGAAKTVTVPHACIVPNIRHLR